MRKIGFFILTKFRLKLSKNREIIRIVTFLSAGMCYNKILVTCKFTQISTEIYLTESSPVCLREMPYRHLPVQS